MKKLTLGIFVIVCWLNAWEINAHRTIYPIDKADNIQINLSKTQILIQGFDYNGGTHSEYPVR